MLSVSPVTTMMVSMLKKVWIPVLITVTHTIIMSATTTSAQELSYYPGQLNNFEENLYLSQGLKVQIIARSGQPVAYANGGQSNINFHGNPDGAAIFEDTSPSNPGGWIYVSNSEVEAPGGGVGAIYFDKSGNILQYKMLLTGTDRNCAGGKTEWNTWISCEESAAGTGVAYQIDPSEVNAPAVITPGNTGGAWESYAQDTRDPSKLVAFLSEDEEYGALQRTVIPNPNYNDPWNILLQPGSVDYLFLKPKDGDCGNGGTYEWTTDAEAAKRNAHDYYPSSEGLERIDNQLFLVSKELKGFFILDLDTQTFIFESTGFEGQPDQRTTVFQDDGTRLTYFTEEAPPIKGCAGEQVGIYARYDDGKYTRLLYGSDLSPETTGIAFSPDGIHMYFAYQAAGLVYEAIRTDGLSFTAAKIPPKCSVAAVSSPLLSSVRSAWHRFRGYTPNP